MFKSFCLLITPYLTFTTAKVKIKFSSLFFLIPMAVDIIKYIYRYDRTANYQKAKESIITGIKPYTQS